MKKSLLLMLAAAGLTLSVAAQTPPAAVKTGFEKHFPGATKVKWDKEGTDEYEAEFQKAGKEYSAVFDSKGTLKETEEEMKPSELPAAVTAYISQHYKNAVIKEAARITTPNGVVTYEAEVNKKDLLFDATGKFIK